MYVFAQIQWWMVCSKINALTMDVIAATAFGIDAEAQTNSDNPFYKHALAIIRDFEGGTSTYSFLVVMLACEYQLNLIRCN